MDYLYFVICHIATLVMVASAYTISHKVAKDSDKRLIVVAFCIISSVLIVRTLTLYGTDVLSTSAALSSLFVGLFSVCTYALYPLSRLFPQRLEGWNVLQVYLPVYVALVAYYLVVLGGGGVESFVPIETISRGEFFDEHYIFQTVAILLSFAISIFPAACALRVCNDRFLRVYSFGITVPGVCVLLIFFIPEAIYTVLVAYQLWVCAFAITINYLIPSEHIVEQGVTSVESVSMDQPIDTMWHKVQRAMREGEPWRDPNFRIDTLAKMVHSNRTTVSALIRKEGHKSFQDFVAEFRIEAFCDFARENHVHSIADLFVETGFLSASSAFKHFKRIHNMTPAQYLNASEQTVENGHPKLT